MLRPSGVQKTASTSAPIPRKTRGAMSLDAPLAQSMIILSPRSEMSGATDSRRKAT
jgi:hypothetical protein